MKNAGGIEVTETNVSELKNIRVTMFKNSETIVLDEGTDYQLHVTGGDGMWFEYKYVLLADNFEEDGVYRIAFHSEDGAGNVAENTQDTKGIEIEFGVDNTLPNIIVANLDSGMTYALDSLKVLLSVSDNLLLSNVAVYLDDYSNAYKTWTSEEILAAVNGELSFDIPGTSTQAHSVKIVCTDAAGNEQTEEITRFYVTTDIFVRYYNNKVLFFGSIIGGTAAVAAAVGYVVYAKKKRNA